MAVEASSDSSTTLGIDLGTSNCAAAVWDSARGSPKWIRFDTTLATPQGDKKGRIIPSAVILALGQHARDQISADIPLHNVSDIVRMKDVVAIVGSSAVRLVEEVASSSSEAASNKTTNRKFTAQQVSDAYITSAKRVIGSETPGGTIDPDLLETLPFRVTQGDDDDIVKIQVTPLGGTNAMTITPGQVMAILLQAICRGAQDYLQQNIRQRKKLQVPGDSWQVGSCVIGVPAHLDHAQRHAIVDSAAVAGLKGATLTESTAAAMSYGLIQSEAPSLSSSKKCILVLDVGGGTTDITIAEMNGNHQQSGTDGDFSVLVTLGNPRLGGDDMDVAILKAAMAKMGKKSSVADDSARLSEHKAMLRKCKHAKELLCGDVDHGDTLPKESVSIEFDDDGKRIDFGQDDLRDALEPVLRKLGELIDRAMERLANAKKQSSNSSNNDKALMMDEVILVGGATRVPMLRDFVRSKFPPPHPKELCLSVNAMSAVAKGCAVKAAINSKLVPLHELRSAMMLDTVPYDIGVLLEGSESETATTTNRFVNIISRDSTLPATGSAMFQLADLKQKGVTLNAVECVSEQQYVSLGTFTFLLHRLTDDQLARLQGGTRSVEIQMSLKETGEFVVAVFDENDPEQRRRRKRFKQKSASAGPLSFSPEGGADEEQQGLTQQEIILIMACIFLAGLYMALKQLFQEELSNLTSQ